jgi:hypothetical protein
MILAGCQPVGSRICDMFLGVTLAIVQQGSE